MAATAAFNSFNSAEPNLTDAVAMFSFRCATLVVPGIGTIHGVCALNQASDS